MEEDLDLIASHESESETWLNRFYFGNGATGLLELVSDEHLTAIDAREVNTIPLGVDADGNDVAVRVGRYGPYLQRGDDTAPLPEDLAPDELTIADALERLERGADGGRVLGIEPATGLEVVARDGRYGPYVSVGEHGDNGEKPRTGSLLKTMTLDSLTLDDALQLLSLPRIVGVDAEGNEITALNGRYGPYLKKGTDSRSLETEEQLFTITMPEAEAIFALPKRRGRRAAKPPIAELGPHPDSAAPIRVLDGRFGPYVTDGTHNATIPRGTDPAGVTLEEAVALLRARAERGPAKKRKTAKKKPAAKKAPKKKPPAKKAAAKKTGAKKAAKRTTAKKAVAAGSSNPVPSEAPDPSEDET